MDMTAIIDRSVLEEVRTLGGPGEDFLSEVIGVFLAEGPDEIRSVKEALTSSDAAAVHRAAHRLTGSARGVGAGRLATVAAEIERAARAGDLDHAAAGAAGLDAAFEGARVGLAAYLDRPTAGLNP